MKGILKIVGVILVIFIVVFSCNKIISKKIEKDINKSPSMEYVRAIMEMKSVAEIMNSNLPAQIDENTLLTNVEYSETDNKLIFRYTINDVTKEEIQNVISDLKSNQIEFIKNSPENGAYLKAKVTFEYIYFDLDKNEIGQYIIIADEYMN